MSCPFITQAEAGSPSRPGGSSHTTLSPQAKLGRAETTFLALPQEPLSVPLRPPPAPQNPQTLPAWPCHPWAAKPKASPTPLRAKVAGPAGAVLSARAPHPQASVLGRAVVGGAAKTPIHIQAGDPLEPPSPDGPCGEPLLSGSNWKLRWAVVRGLATGAPEAHDGWGGQLGPGAGEGARGS